MRIELSKQFFFHAAHHLPNVPDDHKCKRPHGHSYTVEVHVEGEVDPHLGWLMDYADIKEAWLPLGAQLDHYDLNGIAGLENPTSENLAAWIWERLQPTLPELSAIVVFESPTAKATYRGES